MNDERSPFEIASEKRMNKLHKNVEDIEVLRVKNHKSLNFITSLLTDFNL